MTKKELISKLDELGGRFEEVESFLSDALREIKSIKNLIDDLPSEPNEIEDSVKDEE